MRVEMPILNRCCFCFPSRHGLLFLAYVRLLCFAFFIYVCSYRVCWLLSPWIEVPDDVYPLEVTSASLNAVFNITNFVFSFVLILAAHKKSVKIFKAVYSCECIVIFVNTILILVMLIIDTYVMWSYGMDVFHYARLKVLLVELLLPDLLYLCVQFYTIILVKHQIEKLSSNREFRFVNSNDIECACVDDINRCDRDDNSGSRDRDCATVMTSPICMKL